MNESPAPDEFAETYPGAFKEQPDTVQFEDSTGVMRTLTDPEGALFVWDSDRDVAVSENGYEVTALALAVAAKSRKHRWQHLNEAIAEAGPRHRYEDLDLAATPFDPAPEEDNQLRLPGFYGPERA